MEIQDIEKKLAECRQLPKNWDSYGGVALTADAHAGALWIARHYADQITEVHSTPEGFASLNVERGGNELTVEVEGPHVARFMLEVDLRVDGLCEMCKTMFGLMEATNVDA